MSENFDQPVQVATFANSLSSSKWSDFVESADFLAFCRAAAQAEIDLGMNRNREATGQVHELMVYEMFSTGSFRFSTMLSSLMTSAEAIVRTSSPKSVLSVGNPGLLPLLATENFESLVVSNDVHLAHAEKNWTSAIGDYSTVSWQDIDSGTLPSSYDCILVSVPSVAHDIDILKTLASFLTVSGTMVMLSATDHGNLFKYRENHDYYSLYFDLKEMSGFSFSLIPSGLGIGVLTRNS